MNIVVTEIENGLILDQKIYIVIDKWLSYRFFVDIHQKDREGYRKDDMIKEINHSILFSLAGQILRFLVVILFVSATFIIDVKDVKADTCSVGLIMTGMEESKNCFAFHKAWFAKNKLNDVNTYYLAQYVVPDSFFRGGITINQFEEELDRVFKGMTSEDTGYLIYCGHGSNLPSGFLVQQPAKTYSYSDMLKRICSYSFKHMFIILDCCYAGSVVKAYKGLPVIFQDKISILFASQANQQGYMFNDLKYGPYTETISYGLNDKLADTNPHDGKITVSELADYTKQNIEYYYRQHVDEETFKSHKAPTPGCVTTKPNEVIYITDEYKTVNSKPQATILTKLTEQAVGKVTISWKKQSVDGYQIRYSLNNNMSNVKSASTTKTSLSRSGLIGGKTYYFQVRTYNVVNGKKVYSNWSVMKAIKLKKLPPATSITSLTANSSSKFTVKWTKKSSVKGYQVRYSTDSSFRTKKTASTTGTSMSKSNLSKGTYYVSVRTFNIAADGTKYYSAWSTTKSVTLKNKSTTAGYPTGTWVTGGNSGSIEVEFSPGYVYYYQYGLSDFSHTKLISTWKRPIKSITKSGNIFTIVVYATDGSTYTYKTNPSNVKQLWYYMSNGLYSGSSSLNKLNGAAGSRVLSTTVTIAQIQKALDTAYKNVGWVLLNEDKISADLSATVKTMPNAVGFSRTIYHLTINCYTLAVSEGNALGQNKQYYTLNLNNPQIRPYRNVW